MSQQAHRRVLPKVGTRELGMRNDEADGLAGVSANFDGFRLRQARQLKALTRQDLAARVGVSAAAIGQYEVGTSPRPRIVVLLADCLDVPPDYFRLGRPRVEVAPGETFMRSLRSTTAWERNRASSYVEQVWELAHALERHIRFPDVDLPESPHEGRLDPFEQARQLRAHWKLGTGPIRHLVRTIESRGVITVLIDLADNSRIDAFSVDLQRPVIVLTPDRADDVLRHRFTAAHELGHLVLHRGIAARDAMVEKEADRFAAEFLTPRAAIQPSLPARLDWRKLDALSREWGVSMDSLVYRCREVGLLSEPTARRAFIRINTMRASGELVADPATMYPGEVPQLLNKAAELAATKGVTVNSLARELGWHTKRVTALLGGKPDSRPRLSLV